MKRYQGSFTVEAAIILPIILFCICLVIELGVSMHNEVKIQVGEQIQQKKIDMIKCMYRKEWLESFVENFTGNVAEGFYEN